ncbi:hypothetical protein [Mesorhizobium sp. B1-1-5]|uniref:hypothetical protein n=1 Tax=Mesorhizobium sp. B1-1-5 TaxID=2589979 RepID=UPI001FEFA77E|nr:hypothetical protein [Mesorhizobium sp. B1-1-5]
MAQHKTTFGGVDILRCLAAVMVMFYHYMAAVALMALSLRPDFSWPGWRRIGLMTIRSISSMMSSARRCSAP